MQAILLGVIRAFRAAIRGLATERASIGSLEKLLRGALLVPLYGSMLVLLRAWAALRGPLCVPATTLGGARFTCLLPDMIQTYLYVFGVWEPDLTAFIRRRLSPGDTFVDVGANIGYHVLLAAASLDGGGRVVAFEASPRIFGMLQENLAGNRVPAAVRAVNVAVADAAGTQPIFRGPVQNIGLTTTVRGRGLQPDGEVAAAPLSQLLEPVELRTARLVKIDVEGAEDAVLRGMNAFLAGCRADVEIVVELSPKWWADAQQTPRQVLQPLLDAGFNVYRIDNNLWPWRYLWPNDVRPPRPRPPPPAGGQPPRSGARTGRAARPGSGSAPRPPVA
jgi:FkbM family methyltransferase